MPEQLRIVVLGTAYPFRGGLASFNERMARGLQDMGHEVILYTFTLQYPDILFPGKTQYVENEPPPAGLEIREKVNSVNPLNWWKVGRELNKLAPDLLIAKFWLPFMGPCLGTILRLARRNGRTRVLSVIDNIIPHEKRPGDRPFARYFAGAVDGFIAMSRSVEKDMEQFTSGQPVRYVPHPVYDNYGESLPRETALEVLGLDPEYRYLLFFGFIRDYKGLDLLLRAMSDGRIRQQPWKLIVAGEYYGNRDEYEELIRVLDISDRLELHTDFIPNEQVRFFFSAADLVVQPYKTATQSGISQLAYHFEKPMVVTRVGGLPEIVPDGEAGYVVDPQPVAIAEAILRFFGQEDLSRFANCLKEQKKRYSWEHFLGELLELRSLKNKTNQ